MAETDFIVDKENLEVRTSRVFEASPQRLWQAYTDPTEIPKWWGPGYLDTVVDKMDIRIGGQWRFIQTEPDGKEHAFSGVYKEVVEPKRLVDTFEYEPIAGHILVETMTLEVVEAGKTKLSSTAKYANLEDLEGMVSMGMEGGQRESMDRLAKLVS